MPEADEFIQIRLSAARKERWKDAANDDPEWRNVTDLIVSSVEQNLLDVPTNDGADVDLGPVHDRFDNIGEQLNDIEDRLDETYFIVREDESNYTEITARIHDLVPEVSGDRERDALLSDDPREDVDAAEGVRRTGSVSHLVQHLQDNEGFKPLNVKNAVERLAANSTTIQTAFARPQDEKDMRVFRVSD